jgi:hypothetical protein
MSDSRDDSYSASFGSGTDVSHSSTQVPLKTHCCIEASQFDLRYYVDSLTRALLSNVLSMLRVCRIGKMSMGVE